MKIVKATKEDISRIMCIYKNAREFMVSQGNEQWPRGYPEKSRIEKELSSMYLCLHENQITCVFYFAVEEDEDYGEINGQWLNNQSYGVVHRIASTGIIKGAAQYCLDWCYQQYPNIRIDTYKDNIPMLKLLDKCGFHCCGTFERIGKTWFAYQKASGH